MKKMVTLNEIAKIVNLSKSTVSKYINGENLRKENRDKIKKVIDELDYRPNFIARGLKTARTYTVGVLVPFLTDLFSSTIIAVIEQEIRKIGYAVIVSSYRANDDEFKDKYKFLCDKMIDAIVVFPSGIEKESFSVSKQKELPIITIDKKIEGLDADSVLIDNVDICNKAIDHLCKQGHKKIAVLTGHESSFTARKRVEGCLKAFEFHNISKDDYLIKYGNFSFDSGLEEGKKILAQNKHTAVFATNYYLSNGFLKAVNLHKKSIPEDISFVGFDSMQISEIYSLPLTLVTQPMVEMGVECAKILIERLKEKDIVTKKDVVLKGNIVEGCSIKKL